MMNLKKFFSGMVLLALVFTMIPVKAVLADGPVVITPFADANLETCVRTALGGDFLNPETPITDVDALTLTSLNCQALDDSAPEDKITNLTGLAHFTNLTSLNLAVNSISNISALGGLTALENLDLSDNNSFDDISSLSGLTSLEHLDLGNNLIMDVSALGGLTALIDLNISVNLITNISSLSGLTSLTSLDVSCDPLNEDSLALLVTLTGNGVDVINDQDHCDINPAITDAWVTNNSGSTTVYILFNTSLTGTLPPSGLETFVAIQGREGTASTAALQSEPIEHDGTTYTDQIIVATFAAPVVPGSIIQAAGAEAEVTYYGDPEPDGITFPDLNLEVCLRGALGGDFLNSETPIMEADALTLTSLSCQAQFDAAPEAKITDLTGLEYFTHLTFLNLTANSITDLSPLRYLTALDNLGLANNLITDIEDLSGLTHLTNLDVRENSISGIIALSNSTSLTSLNLSHNSITNISALSDLMNLTSLNLSHNPALSDIRALVRMTSLTDLDLGNDSVYDLSPLSGLTGLTTLRLNNAGSFAGRYRSLIDITDLEFLTSLTYLDLEGNSVWNIQPLVDNAGLGTGDTVNLSNNLLTTESQALVSVLTDRGVDVLLDGNGSSTVDWSAPTGDDYEFTMTANWPEWVAENPILLVFWRGDVDLFDAPNIGAPNGIIVLNSPGTTRVYVPHIPGQELITPVIGYWEDGAAGLDGGYPSVAGIGETISIVGSGGAVENYVLNMGEAFSAALVTGDSDKNINVRFLFNAGSDLGVDTVQTNALWTIAGVSPESVTYDGDTNTAHLVFASNVATGASLHFNIAIIDFSSFVQHGTGGIVASACSEYTYSDWGTCSDGQQTRTVATSSPEGCTIESPVLEQSCEEPVTCTSFTYSDWGTCSDSQQTRTVVTSSPESCTGGTPVVERSCEMPPVTCTSFTYSDWGTCSDSQQTRTVVTSSPESCTGGTPVVEQSCSNGGGGGGVIISSSVPPVKPPVVEPPVVNPPVVEPPVVTPTPTSESTDSGQQQESTASEQALEQATNTTIDQVISLIEGDNSTDNQVASDAVAPVVDFSQIKTSEVYSDSSYARSVLSLVVQDQKNCGGDMTMSCLEKVYGLDKVQGNEVPVLIGEKEIGDAVVFGKKPGEVITVPRIVNLKGTLGSNPIVLAMSAPNDQLVVKITAEVSKKNAPVKTIEGYSDEEGKGVLNLSEPLKSGNYSAEISALRNGKVVNGNKVTFTVDQQVDTDFNISDMTVTEENSHPMVTAELGSFVKFLLAYTEKLDSRFIVKNYVEFSRTGGKVYIVRGNVDQLKEKENAIVYLAYKSVTFGSAVISDASQHGSFQAIVPKVLGSDSHTLNAYAFNPKKNVSTSVKKVAFVIQK